MARPAKPLTQPAPTGDIPIADAIAVAEQCLARDLIPQAKTICLELLAKDPDNAAAIRLLGVTSRKQGRLDEAAALLLKSITLDPRSAPAHQNLGDVLRTQGKLQSAIAEYTRATELDPNNPGAFGALGSALLEAANLESAITAFRRAIALQPSMAIAHVYLGDALRDQGKIDAAIDSYSTAILLRPDLPQAYNSLGNVLWDQRQTEQSIAAYSKAIELRPGYLEPNFSLGKIHSNAGRLPQALICFARAVEFNPENPKAHLHYARVLAQAQQREQACAEYRRAIALRPDEPDWQFELAAVAGDNSIPAAPSSYIKRLFDSYAPTFDQHLTENLAYRAPRDLLEAVVAATDKKDWDVLDLGCGTGLCGVEFRPMARYLTGVDLSAAMIRAAAERRIYDELLNLDLLEALSGHPGQYDVIVAGDVLVYVGNLSHLMPAVAASLKGRGLFAFSIEDYNGPGYFLHSQERFAHSMSYILEHAAAAGLSIISDKPVVLRRHAGAATPGRIVLLGKSAGAT